MGTIKWRFLQNGSLNNFDFWQICFIIDQIIIPMGSGQLFLTDGPTVIVARRGQAAYYGLRWIVASDHMAYSQIFQNQAARC